MAGVPFRRGMDSLISSKLLLLPLPYPWLASPIPATCLTSVCVWVCKPNIGQAPYFANDDVQVSAGHQGLGCFYHAHCVSLKATRVHSAFNTGGPS